MRFFSSLRSTFRLIRIWFNQLPFLWKITVGLIATGTISFISIFFPESEPLGNAPTWVRLGVVIFLFISLLWSLIALWERGEKTDELSKKVTSLKTELESTTAELQQLEKEKSTLLEVDEIIWTRPDNAGSRFVPMQDRKTVILSMFNLKGGVGKTTLTANLAACLATMEKPVRTLIVDLDFQGTLSDMCVAQEQLILLRQTKNTVASLLEENAEYQRLQELAVGVSKIPNAMVVCAHDRLDTLDFTLQAQFFLDQSKEVRFRFQKIFHMKELYNLCDLLIFDCPPRLTTSAVNALTCSDFVLIPTKLDRSSVTAVPRTLHWMAKMGRTVQAQPIGVVSNETQMRNKKLIGDHQNAYNYLAEQLLPPVYRKLMFNNTVEFSNKVAHTKASGVVAALDDSARSKFSGVAEELRERLGI